MLSPAKESGLGLFTLGSLATDSEMESCTEQASKENFQRTCGRCPQAGEKLTHAGAAAQRPPWSPQGALALDGPQRGPTWRPGPGFGKGIIPTLGDGFRGEGPWGLLGAAHRGPCQQLEGVAPAGSPRLPLSAMRLLLVLGHTSWFFPYKKSGGITSTK